MNKEISRTSIPLCVDMDGTLIRTDSLVETIAILLKQHLFIALLLPLWILKGRAHFKDQISRRVQIDAAFLPYEPEVLNTINRAREQGREIILCTGANNRYAEDVADHLGVFDAILASDEAVNLSGRNKARALTTRFGKGGYDYIGNDSKDLPAFRNARTSFLVAPTIRLRMAKASLRNATILVPARSLNARDYLSQIRIHQWLKNILLFVALLASQRYSDLQALLQTSLGFIAFGLCASSAYVLNDLMDLPADRRHLNKRNRPFASGSISASTGILLLPLLALLGFATASYLDIEFIMVLLFYYFLTLNYSLWSKNIVVLDTLFLAGLYTLRIIAGAAAIDVIPSFWLLAFSMFLFLSVALAKRYSELVSLDLDSEQVVPGRQYRTIDLSTLMSQGAASGYAAVLVMALYINSEEVSANYSHPEVIWLTCPLLVYWINKLWLNTQRREMHDDPLVWAIENRVSRAIAVIFSLLLYIAI